MKAKVKTLSEQDNFRDSRCGIILRRLSEKLESGHLLNAIYEATELLQEMLKEHALIRHGKQKDASWIK